LKHSVVIFKTNLVHSPHGPIQMDQSVSIRVAQTFGIGASAWLAGKSLNFTDQFVLLMPVNRKHRLTVVNGGSSPPC